MNGVNICARFMFYIKIDFEKVIRKSWGSNGKLPHRRKSRPNTKFWREKRRRKKSKVTNPNSSYSLVGLHIKWSNLLHDKFVMSIAEEKMFLFCRNFQHKKICLVLCMSRQMLYAVHMKISVRSKEKGKTGN